MTLSSNRDNALDNLRFFLIFLVVFVHFLEICALFSEKTLVYQMIYAFHMPAF